ncbi:hypothetical protein [Streptacidiphilus melanogenes]|uniref:hypothetical protein n=1 Tax=Streptacidiphilus melanogenes TaxID=411235 RepID=UPI0005AB90CB|nr:hypothetical protein [Streptacidiphilus melanogenes]
MVSDDPYTAARVAAAGRLSLSGAWDLALALLDGADPDGAPEVRAQILVERNWWCLDDPAAALAAVRALPETSPQAAFLGAQLAYTRLLFGLQAQGGDEAVAEAGFRAATEEPTTADWGTFWLGVLRQNIAEDEEAARPYFDEALVRCRADGDLLLESYVVRHLSGYEPDPLPLLRRSLHLRAALGARPQVAAAQMTLWQELPEGPERDLMREAALSTAQELGLTWMLKFLD